MKEKERGRRRSRVKRVKEIPRLIACLHVHASERVCASVVERERQLLNPLLGCCSLQAERGIERQGRETDETRRDEGKRGRERKKESRVARLMLLQ